MFAGVFTRKRVPSPKSGVEMINRFLCVFVTLAAFGCGASPTMASYVGEDRTEDFMQADFNRYYHVHVPNRPEVGPAAPLVLAFHGSGQTGEDLQARSGLNAVADAEGFIVVYLQAAMGVWDIFGDLAGLGLDDVAYVRQVIDRVSRTNVIDRHRIIAVGLSNGGVFSQGLGCKLADRLAGFVAVAATMPTRLAETCHPSRPISALYLTGSADTFFPIAGSKVLLSLDATLGLWGQANDCDGSRLRSSPIDQVDDGTVVYHSTYRGCDDNALTALDSIVGGGHAWPGAAVPAPASFGPTSQEISANLEIARFLRALKRD
jgi:polyhydroxybutyrate depolymerase